MQLKGTPYLPEPHFSSLHLEKLDLSVLEKVPLKPLEVGGTSDGNTEGSEPLDTHLLPLVMLRLGSPGEVADDILGHLGLGGFGTVIVLHYTFVEGLSHSDSTTGEVRVVVKSFTDGHTSGGLSVTVEEGENVVLSPWTGLHHERQIGGHSTTVGSTSSLLVGVGRKHVVSELSRALEHLSLIVGSISELHLRKHLLYFSFCVADTDEGSVCNTAHTVAACAHLLVYLVSSPDGRSIESVEHTLVAPGVVL
mmetsp:Transcript_6953/g.17652  ORF Transcript_6953/g.17652 Transcript_6953/m.17652 type:complete len:251 (-) Transcript_6953:449-1201(-)